MFSHIFKCPFAEQILCLHYVDGSVITLNQSSKLKCLPLTLLGNEKVISVFLTAFTKYLSKFISFKYQHYGFGFICN